MATISGIKAMATGQPSSSSTCKHEECMTAAEWKGTRSIKINDHRPKPKLAEPTDAIVRIIYTTICGSDLHLYHNEIPGMQDGDVIGHEGVGIVEEDARVQCLSVCLYRSEPK